MSELLGWLGLGSTIAGAAAPYLSSQDQPQPSMQTGSNVNWWQDILGLLGFGGQAYEFARGIFPGLPPFGGEYGGTLTAPLLPEQQQLKDRLFGKGSQYQPGQYDPMIEAFGKKLMAGEPTYLPEIPDISPEKTAEYWQKAVGTPMMREWQEEILPQIEGRYREFGSSGRRAVERSGGRLTEALAGSLGGAQLSNQQLLAKLQAALEPTIASQYNLAQAGQLTGANLLSSLAGAPMTRAMSEQAFLSPYWQHADITAQREYANWAGQKPDWGQWAGQAGQMIGYPMQNQYWDPGQQGAMGASMAGGVQGLASVLPWLMMSGGGGAGNVLGSLPSPYIGPTVGSAAGIDPFAAAWSSWDM